MRRRGAPAATPGFPAAVPARRWRVLVAALVVVGASLTTLVAHTVEQAATDAERVRLERDAERDVQRLQREINRYKDGAAALRSFVWTADVLTQEAFESFVAVLDVPRRYPGVESTMWAYLVRPAELDEFVARQREARPQFALRPPGAREEYRIVTYVAPLEANAKAIGFDIRTNAPAVETQEKARDSGHGAATPAVPLAHATGEKGFVVLAPVYHGDEIPPDVPSRRAQLRGWVAMPVRANVLLADIFPANHPRSIEVFAGTLAPESLVASLDSPEAPLGRGTPHVAHTDALGRTWYIRVTGPAPAPGLAPGTVLVLMVGMVLIGFLTVAVRSLLQRNATLRSSSSLLETVTSSLHEGLVVVRNASEVVAANPSAAEILGLSGPSPTAAITEALRQARFTHGETVSSLAELVAASRHPEAADPDGDVGMLTSLTGPGGDARWVRIVVTPIDQGAGDTIDVVVMTDVTDQTLAENRLRYQAQHDDLTSLASRARFLERLGQLLDFPDFGRPVAVIFIDLDGVKAVNDTYGHPVGDQLLRVVAHRLRSAALAGHLTARLGGDEFALVGYVLSEAEARQAAEQLLRALDEPVTVGPTSLWVGASAGVAIRHDGSTPESILAEADAAMYRSKELGGHRVTVYDDVLRMASRHRLGRAEALRQGLRDGDIFCVFQPMLDLASGRVCAVEALARWRSDAKTVLEPMDFLPMVGHAGLGPRLTDLVVRQAACYQQTFGLAAGLERVWVNLSGNDLAVADLADHIVSAIRAAGADPRHFGVEVTEHERIQNVGLAGRVLDQLHRAGLAVALDDFGTGHSYIQLLSELPVDSIKLDKSLVQMLPRAREHAIVTALVEMAHSLSLTVTAEGVETTAQLMAVQSVGCDRAQGFLIDSTGTATQMVAGDCEGLLPRYLPEAVDAEQS